MSDDDDFKYFQMREQGKTYISKVFNFRHNPEEIRNVRMIFEGNDKALLGEIQGALCLRLTGRTRKTQVTALITQDDKRVKRLSFQTFQSRSGDWYQGYESGKTSSSASIGYSATDSITAS